MARRLTPEELAHGRRALQRLESMPGDRVQRKAWGSWLLAYGQRLLDTAEEAARLRAEVEWLRDAVRGLRSAIVCAPITTAEAMRAMDFSARALGEDQ